MKTQTALHFSHQAEFCAVASLRPTVIMMIYCKQMKLGWVNEATLTLLSPTCSINYLWMEMSLRNYSISRTNIHCDITHQRWLQKNLQLGNVTILSSVLRGGVISALHSLMSHKNRLTGSLNDLERSQPFVSDIITAVRRGVGGKGGW